MSLWFPDLISVRIKIGEDQYGILYGADFLASCRIEIGGRRGIDSYGKEYIPEYTIETTIPIPREALVKLIRTPLLGELPTREFLVKGVKGAQGFDGETVYEVFL